MTTYRQARHSHFQHGSGVFQCQCCGRNARDTGDNGQLRLCTECFDLAGEENHISDTGGELYHAESARAAMESLRKHGKNPEALFPDAAAALAKLPVVDHGPSNAGIAKFVPVTDETAGPEVTAEIAAMSRAYCVALVTDKGEFMVAVNAKRAKAAKREAAKLVQGTVVEAHAFLM